MLSSVLLLNHYLLTSLLMLLLQNHYLQLPPSPPLLNSLLSLPPSPPPPLLLLLLLLLLLMMNLLLPVPVLHGYASKRPTQKERAGHRGTLERPALKVQSKSSAALLSSCAYFFHCCSLGELSCAVSWTIELRAVRCKT